MFYLSATKDVSHRENVLFSSFPYVYVLDGLGFDSSRESYSYHFFIGALPVYYCFKLKLANKNLNIQVNMNILTKL